MCTLTNYSKEKNKMNKIPKYYAWLAIGLVIVLYCISWILICRYFTDFQDRANFGDMFGAVNALFTGLAFAGVIITILLQKEELSRQSQEMQNSRVELQGQKIQLENQSKLLAQQAFENTFFQLLEYHNNFIRLMKYNNSGGNDAIRSLLEEFGRKYYEGRASPTDLQFLQNIYGKFYDNSKHHYLPFINNLLFALELIANAQIENKIFYANILKSQLSIKAKELVFYHVLSRFSDDFHIDLVRKYNLFSELSESDLLVKEHIVYKT